MTLKQRVVLFTFSIILLLSVIGLSIGLVLVASQARLSGSMRLTYEAKNIECTISSTAQVYDRGGVAITGVYIPTPDSISIKASDKEAVGSMNYEDEIVLEDNGRAYVMFVFTIFNDASEGATPICAELIMLTQGTNMLTTITNVSATNIPAGDNGEIVAIIRVNDPLHDAAFNGAMKLTVSQVNAE